ncbi:MAG: sigma 54-interacting transcriptional regulator [Pseudomonadota bacterium]
MKQKTPIGEHLDLILENMVDGLFTVDADCTITYWNKAAEDMLGYSREEVIGRTCDVLTSPSCMKSRSADPDGKCRLFSEGKIVRRRCMVLTKNGSKRFIIKNARLLRDGRGEIIGGVENIVDITDQVKQEQQVQQLRRRLKGRDGYCKLIGSHHSMQKIYELVELAKHSTASVLILGESGTGKELVAQAIHHASDRSTGPFVTVNCAALAESLLESELFGHVKGAFTDAIRDRKGRFEEAAGGTILLDEIGDMPLAVQIKLLRVLQEKMIERVGDNRQVKVDVRIIAATHADLPRFIQERKFREDLYYRLNVIPIRVPPLRDRKTDLPQLIEHFFEKHACDSGLCMMKCSHEALALLMQYDWPGNVRELENVLEYAIVTSRGEEIGPANLPEHLLQSPSAEKSCDDKKRIELALKRAGGKKAEAAAILGCSRVTLWKKLKHYNITAAQQTRDEA